MIEKMGYDLTKGSGLNFGKRKRALLRSFVQKAKTLIIITRHKEDSVMYLCQSRQILIMKKRFIMTTHQQHRHRTQMLASAISSKISQ